MNRIKIKHYIFIIGLLVLYALGLVLAANLQHMPLKITAFTALTFIIGKLFFNAWDKYNETLRLLDEADRDEHAARIKDD